MLQFESLIEQSMLKSKNTLYNLNVLYEQYHRPKPGVIYFYHLKHYKLHVVKQKVCDTLT